MKNENNYEDDTDAYFNSLDARNLQLPDGMLPNVNGLISAMEKFVVIADGSKVNKVGNQICRTLDGVMRNILRNGYIESLSMNNESMAQVCFNRLISLSKDNNYSLHCSNRPESTFNDKGSQITENSDIIRNEPNRTQFRPPTEGSINDGVLNDANVNFRPVTSKLLNNTKMFQTTLKNPIDLKDFSHQSTISNNRSSTSHFLPINRNPAYSRSVTMCDNVSKNKQMQRRESASPEVKNRFEAKRKGLSTKDNVSHSDSPRQQKKRGKLQKSGTPKMSKGNDKDVFHPRAEAKDKLTCSLESSTKVQLKNSEVSNLQVTNLKRKKKNYLFYDSPRINSKSEKQVRPAVRSSERLAKASKILIKSCVNPSQKVSELQKQDTPLSKPELPKQSSKGRSRRIGTPRLLLNNDIHPTKETTKQSIGRTTKPQIISSRRQSAFKIVNPGGTRSSIQRRKGATIVNNTESNNSTDAGTKTLPSEESKKISEKGDTLNTCIDQNNKSFETDEFTHISTPTSTFSCRGGPKRKIIYRRILFSTPRGKN